MSFIEVAQRLWWFFYIGFGLIASPFIIIDIYEWIRNIFKEK